MGSVAVAAIALSHDHEAITSTLEILTDLGWIHLAIKSDNNSTYSTETLNSFCDVLAIIVPLPVRLDPS